MEVNGKDTKEFCRGDKNEIDCFKEEKNRLFIMELVLHCADISNPLKPFNVSLVWSDLVIEEFCRQGDQEVELGLEISPMCDRGQIHVCNMQMGFIEFVVAPLILGKLRCFHASRVELIFLSYYFTNWIFCFFFFFLHRNSIC